MTSPEHRVRSLSLWQGLVSVEPLEGGASNASFLVRDGTGDYVVRVGEDFPAHQVSRVRECVASQAAHLAGLSPRLVHADAGLMVLDHVKARTLDEADVRRQWRACVDLLKRCHRDMPRRISGQGAIFWVFQILRDYALTLQSHNHRMVSHLPDWMALADALEAQQIPLPIIFGHHDLLPGNFLDDGKRLWLIDWEYGAFGTAMFDLANLAAANSFNVALEAEMLAHYFGHAADAQTQRAFSAMKVAAALREALWGMVSEIHLAAPGVDYEAYAQKYLARFTLIRDQHLTKFGLETP